MAERTSDVDMDDPNDQQKEAIVSDSAVPGGKQQSDLPDPTAPEAIETGSMGCTTSSRGDQNDNPAGQAGSSSAMPKGSENQRNNKDHAPKQTKAGGDKTNKRPASGTSGRTTSDDENHRQQSPRRMTRSSASLSPLRINFDDSDDDDNDPRHASYSKRDILEYRSNYPNARSDPRIRDNLDFYTNKISSHPDGDFIDQIHKKWSHDYRKLEFHHGYIQWLFPLQEKGLNWSAEPLQEHEIESIKKNPEALRRILTSYRMMLDFYGFRLIDEKTGEIRRLPGDEYKWQFRNLNTSSHNYLRITRILKCLGEFDYEYLKFPFLETILRESITEGTLSNCLRSCRDYWIETLRSRDERRAIRLYARELLEYRNKGTSPPRAYRAQRPPPTPTSKPTESAGDNDGHMSS